MVENRKYKHAIITEPKNCDGCMNCLRTCPSQALRVKNNTPIILEDRCIDCGECIASCPRKAILPNVDTFTMTDEYKYWVAVPSPVLYAQFGLDTRMKEVHLALHKLGFHYISDVFAACRIQAFAIQEHLNRTDHQTKKPFISSMCPAVVRLIQVNYPNLVNHVIPFEPPRELSAREAKIKVSRKHNVEIKDVGAVYISPCPAKSISVLQPAEKERSFLDGVVAISDIFMPLGKAIMEIEPSELDAFPENCCVFGSRWERSGLMSRSLNIRNWVAVSGLSHVVEICDDIEKGKLDSIAFIEASTCLEGCLGGSLCVENIYVARSKTLMLEGDHKKATKPDPHWVKQLYDSEYFFMKKELKPRRKIDPALSISDAILMMKNKDEVTGNLPGLDCCTCGSPSCETFAEDLLMNKTDLDLCPYLNGKMKSSLNKIQQSL